MASNWTFIVAYAAWVLLAVNTVNTDDSGANVDNNQLPTIFIPLLVRNKAHTLVNFFGCLERLNYPKDRISLWIRSDHNVDNSTEMLKEWVAGAEKHYHQIDFKYKEYPQKYLGEAGPMDWTNTRFQHIVDLRQESLDEARRQWADYYFTTDVDNFLEDVNVLKALLHHGKTIIAPLLTSSQGMYSNFWGGIDKNTIDVDNFLEDPDVLNTLLDAEKPIIAPVLLSQAMYSNFWGGMDDNGYYKRTEEYVQILHRNITGMFQVPMVHSTVLVNLKHSASSGLAYKAPHGYKGEVDDMLTFAYTAREAGIPMYVVNSRHFGQLLTPADSTDSLENDKEAMLHLKLQTIVDRPPLPSSQFIYEEDHPEPDKLGFDEVYMINLKRRPLRRQRMMLSLKWLGIEAKPFDAVDGKLLTSDDLIAMGIDMLPGYRDPHSERVLKKGEIGCFLSHYKVWQEMVQKNYQEVLVLEDDVRFAQGFRPRLERILADVALAQIDYDLIYVGRKILQIKEEYFVKGVFDFVHPSYSYWTVSYILTLRGAKKLLAQEPLGRMIPVDEYLPLMFDKHPERDWSAQFWPRDLKAYSVNPLLAQPTHYIGDNGYFSDTETSNIWEDVIEKENQNEEKGESGKDAKTLEEESVTLIPSVNPNPEKISIPQNVTKPVKEAIKEKSGNADGLGKSKAKPKNEKSEKIAKESTSNSASQRQQDEL